MKRTKLINNEHGFIKFILYMLVLSCMVYVGIKLGLPYFRYSAFKSDAKELARISVGGRIDRTREQVYERAIELKLPLEEEDIVVKKANTGVRIETSWSETVDFLGIYQYTMDFTVDVEG